MAYNKDYNIKDLSVNVSLSDDKNEISESLSDEKSELSASQESNDLVVVEDNKELNEETDSGGNVDTIEEPNVQDYYDDDEEDDEDESYSDYYTEAYKNSKNSIISKIEFKVDWNLISISAIWIFLTLTFFGIAF